MFSCAVSAHVRLITATYQLVLALQPVCGLHGDEPRYDVCIGNCFATNFEKAVMKMGAKANHNGSRGNSHTPIRCGHKSQSENISPYLQAQNWSWCLAVEIKKKDGSSRENRVS